MTNDPVLAKCLSDMELAVESVRLARASRMTTRRSFGGVSFIFKPRTPTFHEDDEDPTFSDDELTPTRRETSSPNSETTYHVVQ
jgi:hypothetical protein